MRLFNFLRGTKTIKAFHGWCTLFWVLLTIVAWYMNWLKSVEFVSLMSMIALFLGSFSAWQGSRTEVKQDKAAFDLEKD